MQDAVSRKILVLGAGMVSSPLIEYHTRTPGTNITVGRYLRDILTNRRIVCSKRHLSLRPLNLFAFLRMASGKYPVRVFIFEHVCRVPF